MPTIKDDCHVCKCPLPRSLCPRSIEEWEAKGKPANIHLNWLRECPWEREMRKGVNHG